jgi:type IV fimbrial biogenesis protein FimT
MRTRAHGFTMVELMIALAIAALLVVLAAPNYTLWVADSQIRNGAESIASGIRNAQAQAVNRNVNVEFVLDPTVATGGWITQDVNGPTLLLRGVFAEGADRVTFTTTPVVARKITYTGLGRIVANADATPTITRVDVTSAVNGSRNLRVEVGGGVTGVKLCDPKYVVPDPKACP